MAKPSNSESEKHYFKQFSEVYRLPRGTIVHGDKPDVIVYGPKKIGIEIRNFFVKPGEELSSEQRQRPLRDEVVANAQMRYLASGGKGVEFTFGFNKNNPVRRSKIKRLSSIIATFARSHDGENSGELGADLYRDTIPELEFIYFNAREYADAKWRVAQVYRIAHMSKDSLESIVREKESKAAEYEVCDTYWLLVIVDGMDAAQEQEIRIDDFHVGSSVFEKVVIFHTFGHFLEIATAARSIQTRDTIPK